VTTEEKVLIRNRLKKYLEMLYLFMHSGYVKSSKLKDLEKEVDDTLKALSLL
jgi:hypothetical protein